MSSLSLLTPEQKKHAIEKIMDYFGAERDERIGIIAAEDIVDEVLEVVGPAIFDNAVDAAKEVVQNHRQAVDLDLELLRRDLPGEDKK